jgi:hypothetical protein
MVRGEGCALVMQPLLPGDGWGTERAPAPQRAKRSILSAFLRGTASSAKPADAAAGLGIAAAAAGNGLPGSAALDDEDTATAHARDSAAPLLASAAGGGGGNGGGTPSASRPRPLRERQNSWSAPGPLDVGIATMTPTTTVASPMGIPVGPALSASSAPGGGSGISSSSSSAGGALVFYDPSVLTPGPASFTLTVNGLLRSLQGWPRRHYARRPALTDLDVRRAPDRAVAEALEAAGRALMDPAGSGGVQAALRVVLQVRSTVLPPPSHSSSDASTVANLHRYGAYRILALLAYARGLGTLPDAATAAAATGAAAPPSRPPTSAVASRTPRTTTAGPLVDELDLHAAYVEAWAHLDPALAVRRLPVDEPPPVEHAALRTVFRHVRGT